MKNKEKRTLDKLSPKHLLFCKEYVKTWNLRQSYKKIYGCSDATADSDGQYLMSDVLIKDYIAKLKKEMLDKADISGVEVVEQLKRFGFSNIQDFLDDDSELLPIKKLPRDVAAAIKSVTHTYTKTGEMKVTFILNDQQKALENLGKHYGIYELDNNHKLDVKVEVVHFANPK